MNVRQIRSLVRIRLSIIDIWATNKTIPISTKNHKTKERLSRFTQIQYSPIRPMVPDSIFSSTALSRFVNFQLLGQP